MRIKEGALMTCPYTNCSKTGLAYSEFKIVVGQSVFLCPKCGRKFAAHVGGKGEIRYRKQTLHGVDKGQEER